ncbi:MAG: BON domain-containing protein [Gammaproteobacteria bacterium]|nr:BON domain-containing protein [Gammaproteobacteria bacterium]
MDKRILAGILAGYFLGPAWSADGDTTATGGDNARPTQVVDDSPITAAIAHRLAEENDESLVGLHVDTDPQGTVWLSGRTYSQAAADHAVAIARGTQGVAQVKSRIVVTPEASATRQ